MASDETSNLLTPGSEIVLTIHAFGFRGEGYAEVDGVFVSVKGALPGEKVRVRLQDQQRFRKRLFADLVEVIVPAKDRIDPQCKYERTCGGCQLRATANATERQFKSDAIREILEKFAGHTPEVVEMLAPDDIGRATGHRSRANYRVGRMDGEPRLVMGTRDPIPMRDCPAHSESMMRTVGRVEDAMAGSVGLEDSVDSVRIASPAHGIGFVEWSIAERSGPLDDVLKRLSQSLPAEMGIAVIAEDEREMVRGPERFRLPVAGLQLSISYEDWFHATDVANDVLYSALLDWIELEDGEKLLDAGCGIGTISLLASKRAKYVLGFDINRRSIESATENQITMGVENVAFVGGGWEKVLTNLVVDGETFERVVVNPMREPLGERAMLLISKLNPKSVTYLAPSPEAGAKDAKVLLDRGWRISRVGAVNLHPATYHVMMLLQLLNADAC